MSGYEPGGPGRWQRGDWRLNEWLSAHATLVVETSGGRALGVRWRMHADPNPFPRFRIWGRK